MLSPEAAGLIIAASFVLTIVPLPLVLAIRYRVSWRWFAYGIASWVLGCIAKSIIHYLVIVPLWPSAWSREAEGALMGLNSGFGELAAAALFFVFLRRRNPRLVDLLAFGVGIGAFEALFLWLIGLVPGEPTPAPGPMPLSMALGACLERPGVLVAHTTGRLLVFLAVRHRWWLAGLIPLIWFTLVDGTASYGGELAKWNWEDPRVNTPFQLFHTGLTAVETVAAWLFWRKAVAATAPSADTGAGQP